MGCNGMPYIKVRWHHSFPNEPVILYSEMDENRKEVRKVEVYADGSCGYAGNGQELGGASLGLVAIPPLEEIAANPQFEPLEMSKEEFEKIWEHRMEHLRNS